MMAVALALAVLYPLLLTNLTGENYMVFPDENGQPYVIDLDAPPLTRNDIVTLKDDLEQVQFHLYTQQNRYVGDKITPGDVDSIANSHWDLNRPTRIIAHGWRGNGKTSSCTLIRDAYLMVEDFNVIIIDWGVIAGSLIYTKVARSVPIVAEYVASFIDFMEVHARLDPATTKLVGHSLGAHLVGLAARSATGTIAEVVALDPARPNFEGGAPGERIDASDAKYVQVIHTNAGTLGFKQAIGTSDFYPNGGNKQPGCSTDIFGACAHSRSFKYFAESIQDPTGFRGFPTQLTALSSYRSEHAYMGGPTLDHNARGAYNLKTASAPPYALG